MTATTRWWWIRHAPVTDAAGRLYGQADVDCDTSDRATFVALAARLPDNATAVLSPLKRTRQTLEALRGAGASLGEPLIEPALAEQNFGRWQGMTWTEMEAADDAHYRRFWRDPARSAPPGGESFAAVIDRCAAAIDRLNTRCCGGDIVAVAHGGSIRAALAVALDLSPERALAIVIDNLSLTRIDHLSAPQLQGKGGAWRVQTVNARVNWICENRPC